MPPEGGDVTFDITAEPDGAATFPFGFSRFGLAGLTAVNYLVEHLAMEPIGNLTTTELPTITPFEEGPSATIRGCSADRTWTWSPSSTSCSSRSSPRTTS